MISWGTLTKRLPSTKTLSLPTTTIPVRHLASVHHDNRTLPDIWFTSASPPILSSSSTPPSPPPAALPKPTHPEEAERKPPPPPPPDDQPNLGHTLRTLSDRLPTLFQSPLPTELLSRQISLHLFPSTHSHLPVAHGPLAYRTALWASPISFGRIPFLHHARLRLQILSERILPPPAVDSSSLPLGLRRTASSGGSSPAATRFIVRWRTQGEMMNKGTGGLYRGISGAESPPVDKVTEFLGGALAKGERDDREFTGIFIFEFDERGRIAKHLIEHVDCGGDMDQLPRVVTLAEWLMRMARGDREEQAVPAFFERERERSGWGREQVGSEVLRRKMGMRG